MAALKTSQKDKMRPSLRGAFPADMEMPDGKALIREGYFQISPKRER